MSSFFTLPGSAKRKRAETAAGNKSKKVRQTDARPARKARDDDEISSDESEDEGAAPLGMDEEDDDEEFAGETAAEKRLRLAQQYLDNIREEVGTGYAPYSLGVYVLC
jgi:ribosomal RNA-processing protein 9